MGVKPCTPGDKFLLLREYCHNHFREKDHESTENSETPFFVHVVSAAIEVRANYDSELICDLVRTLLESRTGSIMVSCYIIGALNMDGLNGPI